MIKNPIVTMLAVSKRRFQKKNQYFVVNYVTSTVFGEIFSNSKIAYISGHIFFLKKSPINVISNA